MEFEKLPHRRYNPLTDEWVKVSPHRTSRPWNGQVEDSRRPELLSYDPSCYLCPGNERAGGRVNPEYTGVFVFDNDFSALLPDVPEESLRTGPGDMIRAVSERGICRVACFSPRHDLTLSRMESSEIVPVVDMWRDQYRELGEIEYISHVQIFENRGQMMGCSNPHPHCQIWSEERIPTLPAKEIEQQTRYYREHGNSLLLDYLQYELQENNRIVAENEEMVALVPFWAVWPFEVMIIPIRPVSSLGEFDREQTEALAQLMRRLGIKMDNLFETSFPYSMGIHQAPTDGRSYPMVQLHLHYFPPLLRSATVKKFMVGYELLAMPQRDLTAETAAQRLRDQCETHFLEKLV